MEQGHGPTPEVPPGAPVGLEVGMEALIGLLLVAVVVAIIARRIHLPYTVALVLVGLMAGAVREWPEVGLSKDLILLVFLPPLLFEGCINIDLEVMRRNALSILLLAVPGTLISVVALGAVLRLAFGLDWAYALLLGAILVPTDPVSVLATFKEAGVRKDLSVLVEGESVLNDGIGVVLFLIFYDIVGGKEVGLAEGLFVFGQEVFVGLVVGIALGVLAYLLLRTIEEELVEVAISLLLAYGSFIVADLLHGSGVIAVVAAGLIMGNFGRTFTMTPGGRITLASFWEVAAFLANSWVFLFIGVKLHPSDFGRPGVAVKAVVAFSALMAIRAAVTYGLLFLARALRGTPPVPWMFVAFWGGLRGTIPIALVLGVSGILQGDPAVAAGSGQLAYTDTQAVVFGVVLISLLVQGLTIKRVLRKLGLVGAEEEEIRLGLAQARDVSARAAEKELDELRAIGEVPEAMYEELREEIRAERADTEASLRALLGESPELMEQRRQHLRRQLLQARRASLAAAARRGIISEEAFHELRTEIDARLAEGGGGH